MARSVVQSLAAIGGELRRLLHPLMNLLKFIGLTIFQLIKQAWLLPRTIAIAVKQRRQQTMVNEHEAERLDRIRNPEKYLGKVNLAHTDEPTGTP